MSCDPCETAVETILGECLIRTITWPADALFPGVTLSVTDDCSPPEMQQMTFEILDLRTARLSLVTPAVNALQIGVPAWFRVAINYPGQDCIDVTPRIWVDVR